MPKRSSPEDVDAFVGPSAEELEALAGPLAKAPVPPYDPAEPLAPGVWIYLWPKNGWAPLDAPRIAADLRALGVRGVVPQSLLDAPVWCTTARVRAFADAGLRLAIGLGSLGPSNWHRLADATCAALDVPACDAAIPDDEGSWDNAEASAEKYVDDVLSRRPDAFKRCVDVPWFDPIKTPSGGWSHPHYPSKTFGRLARRRFPQVYGAGIEGRTAAFLRFARSEYAKLGDWTVRPCVQGYRRSVQDHLDLFLSEPVVLLWDYAELDASARVALRIVHELAARGYRGPDALRAFQRAAGLVVDGLAGPRTAAALGVAVREGVVWRGTVPRPVAPTR